MPRFVFCWDVGYSELPNVESPSIARFWFESNPYCTDSLPGGAGPLGGFGLTDPSHAMDDEHLFRKRWVDEIEAGRMVLVNDGPASHPAVTLREGKWQPASDLANIEAELNIREMIEQAERSRLTHMPILAPRPEPQEPVARQHVRTDKGSGVALLPVRYGVGRRDGEEEQYGYDSPTLARDLPELRHARYVLRTLRAGYLYVLHEDELFGFTVSATGRIRPQDKGKNTSIRVNGDALVFPRDGKNVEVFVAYSEQEWTPSQQQKILDDQDGSRNRHMQRFALESPEQDAFPMAELADRVEEYAGYSAHYRWSQYTSVDRDAAERMTELKNGPAPGSTSSRFTTPSASPMSWAASSRKSSKRFEPMSANRMQTAVRKPESVTARKSLPMP